MDLQHTDWTDRQRLGDLIKTTVFNQRLLDPKDYNKESIIALKQSVNQFLAVDNSLFFTAFRRSASEYILSKDLDAVESRRTIHEGQQAHQVSTPVAAVKLHPTIHQGQRAH
jgi:hypothetical protein